jgi:hypothetical protein
MNVIPPRVHGILDYGTVVFFLLAPTLFSNVLAGGVGTLCYVLAVVHLTMTLLTDFPLGMVEVIALGVHGVIELIVSIALVVLPWILSSTFQTDLAAGHGAQWFYTIVGVVIFAVWALTDYSSPRATSKTSPRKTSPRPKEEPAQDRTTSDSDATSSDATSSNTE